MIFVLCLLFILPYPVKGDSPLNCGLFVTVIQDPPVLSSRKEIVKLIDFAKKAHVKTLFVQIYRANYAWFPSKVGDSSPYEACFKNLSEDPFALLIREAHKQGIKVHAWLNLLSLSNNKDAKLIKKYGVEILTRNLKKKEKIEDYKIDNQYFLEPGDLRVRESLLNMVEEILRNYPQLDGIQFDYIRYPDRHPAYGYTRMNIERFKQTTGLKEIKEDSRVWQNWKRAQVTELVEELAKKIRHIRPGIQVSTTGCAPYVRAYYEAYQDWPLWLKNNLIDFVTVMTYSKESGEFKKYILDAKNKTVGFNNVNFAIGAYELLDSPEVFLREYKLCEESGSAGCVILHYGSLLQSRQLGDALINGGIPRKKFAKR